MRRSGKDNPMPRWYNKAVLVEAGETEMEIGSTACQELSGPQVLPL